MYAEYTVVGGLVVVGGMKGPRGCDVLVFLFGGPMVND
jgi:hypothetical protein